MFRYATLNVIVLMLILGFCLLIKTPVNRKLLLVLGLLLVATVLFDSLLVGSGIVRYYQGRYLGVFIGKAPIEDFAYTIAAVPLMIGLWEYGKRHEK